MASIWYPFDPLHFISIWHPSISLHPWCLLQPGIHLSPCIHCAWLQLVHCASIQSGINQSPSIHCTLLQPSISVHFNLASTYPLCFTSIWHPPISFHPLHFASISNGTHPFRSGIHLAISFLTVHVFATCMVSTCRCSSPPCIWCLILVDIVYFDFSDI